MSILERLETYATVYENEPMSKHTTYRVGGQVAYYCLPKDLTSCLRIIDILKEENLPYFVMGRGSNVLFGDAFFNGAIINLDNTMNEYFFEPDGTCTVEAGCSLINLSVQAMKNGLSGLEFASGIPGSVGGALFMNAGAYKSDMSSIVKEVHVYKDGSLVWMKKDELDYQYRHSIFQSHRDWSIVAAKLQLEPGDSEQISTLMDSRRERRMATQPLDKPSAGSTFRNPEQMPAWKVIDDLGLRGHQIGGAQISEKHSNFIVTVSEDAKAQDIHDLITLIKTRAKETFGIEMKTEVEYMNWPK